MMCKFDQGYHEEECEPNFRETSPPEKLSPRKANKFSDQENADEAKSEAKDLDWIPEQM